MSLFRRDSGPADDERSAARPAEGASLPAGASHVAAGTRVTGTISGSADLLVDGEVHGEVTTDGRVTVGATGRIDGPVRGRSVRLAGRVVGDLAALERVEVLATGHLEGDIAAPRVVITEGAFFKGKVAMAGTSAKAPTRERKS